MDPRRLEKFIEELLSRGKVIRVSVTLEGGVFESSAVSALGSALRRASRELEVDGIGISFCAARSRRLIVVIDAPRGLATPEAIAKAMAACIFAKHLRSRLRRTVIDLGIGVCAGALASYGIAKLVGASPGRELGVFLLVTMLVWGLTDLATAAIYRRQGLKGFEEVWRAIENSKPVKQLTNLIAQILEKAQSSTRDALSTRIL